MPHITHLLNRNPNSNTLRNEGLTEIFADILLNGFITGVLVLLGGLFAGLTLAYAFPLHATLYSLLLLIYIRLMGQDEITLQVLATSGRGRQKSDAQIVLNLLKRGKHWILCTLLLGNVIMNEALPIVLHGESTGGWIAVFLSTGLVVVFGEIIPQSVCAKYGLAVGASSAK